MTDPNPASPRTPPAPVLITAVLVVAVAAWFLLRAYTSPAARECQALYHAARSAADTTVIDTTYTPASRHEKDPRTCGFLRSGSRWR